MKGIIKHGGRMQREEEAAQAEAQKRELNKAKIEIEEKTGPPRVANGTGSKGESK